MSIANNYALTDERDTAIDTTGTDDSATAAGEHSLHPLARWYGLRDFVVVAPASRRGITNESQIRIVLSSLHIAVAESACAVPVFFRALEAGQHVYSGVCESRSHRLTFDVVHLRHVHPSYKYLTGLLDMFKSKVDVAYMNAVQVSVRLAYSLQRFAVPTAAGGNSGGGSTELDFESADMLDDASDEEVTAAAAAADDPAERLFKLRPFRVSIDPLTELRLYCQWTQVADNVVIDSPNYSDFDPLRAPVWRLRARFEAPAICRMSECMAEMVQRHADPQTLADLLGNGFNMLGDEGERSVFDVLTESKITTVLPSFGMGGRRSSASASPSPPRSTTTSKKKRPTGPSKLDGPLNDELLMQMLYYMFPDAQKTTSKAAAHAYVMPETDVVSVLLGWHFTCLQSEKRMVKVNCMTLKLDYVL